MRAFRTLGSIAAAGLLIAACGSSAGATGAGSTAAGPTDAASTDAAATQDPGQPGATDGGGGGVGTGTIDTSHGQAHFEVTGARTASGDLGFFLVSSVFEVNGSGSALLTFVDSESTSLSITYASGQSTVVLATADFGVTLLPLGGTIGTCTLQISHSDASSAAGTFNCQHVAIVNSDAVIGEGTLTGTFDAHK